MQNERKKILVIIFVVFLLIILFVNSCSKRASIFVNWDIHLSFFIKYEELFSDFFRDGDSIGVLSCYSERDRKKILTNNKFVEIDKNNIHEIQIKITEFYNRLNKNEKMVFEQDIDSDDLIMKNSGNYFLIKTKNENKSFIIILYNDKVKKFYLFETFR